MSPTKIKASNWFWTFCGLQLITWTILPTLFRHNVPFDTIESIAWGNQWQFGYDKHPPLAAWLSALFTHLGQSVGWPVYLLGQLAIVTTLWAIWSLAKQILTKEQALVSVLMLFGVLYYSSPSITVKFNPTTLMSPIWALSILVFYNALTKNSIWHWLLLGLCAALSILTKYESAVLLFSMLITMLVTNEGRSYFKTIRPYVAGLIFITILVPHIFWLNQHHFSEITYANNSLRLNQFHLSILNHLIFPLKFLLAQIFAIAPIIILSLPLWQTNKTTIPQNIFTQKFLIIMGIGPFFFTILLSVIIGYSLYPKWATPYFSLGGILLVNFLKPIITNKVFRQFTSLLLGLFISIIFVRGAYIYISPSLIPPHYPDLFFPGKEIANDITHIWHLKYKNKLPYVAGDHYLSANISVYSTDNPTPYFSWSNTESPWVVESTLTKLGAIFVWRADRVDDVEGSYKNLAKRFSTLESLIYKTFPQSRVDAKYITIAYAVLPPQTK